MTTLVRVALTSANGRVERDVIVLDSISMYNLHRCMQYCINPRQRDDDIEEMEFSFHHAPTKKLIKALKTTVLYRASPEQAMGDEGPCCRIGDQFDYEADGKQYLLEIKEQQGAGFHQPFVPRCVASSGGDKIVDAINMKLMKRRFSKQAVSKSRGGVYKASRTKAAPKVWCSKTTPADEFRATYMATARAPLSKW